MRMFTHPVWRARAIVQSYIACYTISGFNYYLHQRQTHRAGHFILYGGAYTQPRQNNDIPFNSAHVRLLCRGLFLLPYL